MEDNPRGRQQYEWRGVCPRAAPLLDSSGPSRVQCLSDKCLFLLYMDIVNPEKGAIGMRRFTLILLIVALVVSGIATIPFYAGAGTVGAAMGQARPGTGVRQIATKDQTKEFSQEFLRVLITGRPFDAFALMKATVPDLESELEMTRQSTEQQFEALRPSFGKPIGYELIQTRSLGESVVRYDYLIKFEKNAGHFRLQYYRPRQVWIPSFIRFTDDISELFEEAGK
jgi:hypothetical protein